MKNFCFLAIALCLMNCLTAQTSGMVNFNEVIKLHLDMEGADAEMMKKMPQTHSIQKTLLFNATESVYKNQVGNQDLDINNQNENGGEVRMIMKSPESTLYADTKNNVMINSQEFFGKQFLVSGENKKRMWKITAEQKSILDYPCMKAVLQDTTNTIAWFTTKLPANMGPSGMTGLPGMILMYDIDNGERVTTASKVELRELKTGEISIPDKGKKVSVEEFDKIRADKMKEMGGTMGKGGTFKVMIRDDRH